MAKKKSAAQVKAESAAKGKRVFEDDPVSTAICKKWGDMIQTGNEVLDSLSENKILSFSPALDEALNGGLMEGGCVVISGDPKVGKTTAALHFAAKAQKLGKKIVYLNTEERISKKNLITTKGLDVGKMIIMGATEECPRISAEMYLNALETYIKNTPNLVAIVDSTSNMVPDEELSGEIRAGVRPGLQKLLSMFFKRTAPDVKIHKAIVILIVHKITNTNKKNPYEPDTRPDGGVMQQYQAQTNIDIVGRGNWTDGEKGPIVGQKVFWNVVTSAIDGGYPQTRAEGWLRYGIGIDEAQEIAHVAHSLNLIKGEGWYTIVAAVEDRTNKEIAKLLKANDVDPTNDEQVTKFFKFQGMKKLVAFLDENDFMIEFLSKKVRDLWT